MSTHAHKVLLVVTSHETLGNTGKPTGSWLAEITHPYRALLDAGIQADIASIQGGKAPVDPASLDDKDSINQSFLSNYPTLLESTPSISSVNPEHYDGILFCGGHGTVWDFPHSTEIQRLTSNILERNGIVAAVCHGPAALIGLTTASGDPLISGSQVTGFSNSEEAAVGLTETVPFLLEDALKAEGGEFSASADFTPNVVEDGPLITGQNPQSAYEVGKALAERLLSGR